MEIASGLNRLVNSESSLQPWEVWTRHPVIRSVAAWRCAPDEKPRWHVHRGGGVDGANAEDILATLDRKENKLALYREKADKVWLLIVCDLFAEGLFIDPPEEPVTFTVPSDFDRIFCLEWTGTRAVEIPIAER